MSTLSSTSLPDQTPVPEATVLVVEDEQLVRKALVNLLESAGFTVLAAEGLDEALSVFSEHRVDVVVSDLIMPGGDGLELLEHLELRDATVPVVIVTGHQSVESASRAVRQGAFDYLVKPVESEPLVRVVSRARDHAIESRRLAREREELEEERAWLRAQNRQRTALLGLLFRELEEGVVVWNREGRLVDASESFLQLAGAKVGLNRAHIDRLFAPHPSIGPASKLVERLYEDRRGSWTGTLTLHGKDGPRDVIVAASLSASEERRHETDQVVALIRELDAGIGGVRHKTEALAHRGRLAATVAHEIKNDLGPLLGYLSMLQIAPDEQEMVDTMRECIRNLEGRLAYLQGSHENTPVGPVPLDQCIERSVSRLRESGFARRVTIKTTIDPTAVVEGRREQLEAAMTCLLVNAIDSLASNPAGQIEVRVTVRAPQALVEVEDNGAGMDEETAQAAFEAFFSTKEPGRGSGLGLTVVRDIVGEHGGAVSLRSTPAVGTVVQFSVPLYLP